MAKKSKDSMINVNNSLTNITSKYCINPELSEQFCSDVLKITGYEVDNEGYLIDIEDEEEAFDPDYVQCKGRLLRVTNMGILHSTDVIFDPYNNVIVMEELFKHYLAVHHPEVSNTQIFMANNTDIPRLDGYGYLSIMYSNGARIKTNFHYKDATKYLDAFMRLESMTDPIINDILKPYDDFETQFYQKYKTFNLNMIDEFAKGRKNANLFS